MKKLAGFTLVAMALVCFTPAKAAEPFRQVGALGPEYVASLACVQEEIGLGQFLDFRERVRRDLGNEAAARVQLDYERARGYVEATPPSQRAEVARRMNCLDNVRRLANEINSLWEDGLWLASR